MSLYCECGKQSSVKVDDLIARFGANYDTNDYLKKLKCSSCGRKPTPDRMEKSPVRIIFSWSSSKASWSSSN